MSCFRHSDRIWREFPELAAGALVADGIGARLDVSARAAPFLEIAGKRLAGAVESDFPEIQAWRRVFSRMGLKPTQYRCASEALLRRLRQEGSLPRIHPVIDLCNAMSAAFAIPVAVFDLDRIAGSLEVRHAAGGENYATFGGQTENPEPDEVIFVDEADVAHARRWTNRQSATSAIRPETTRVLVVAEAMHAEAATDVGRLLATVEAEIRAVWSIRSRLAMLTPSAPEFPV